VANDYFLVGSVSVLSAAILGAGFGWIAFIYKGWLQNSSRRRIEQREKQAQEQKRKARDEARQNRSGR
jgi:16S rRNA C1402 (ribose-2'-O) methylase RsmI